MAARKGKGGGVSKIVWLVIGGIFLLGIGIFLGALLFSSEEFFNGGIDQDNIKNLKVGDCVMSDYTKGHIYGYDYARIIRMFNSESNDGECYVNWVVKGNTQQADFYGGSREGRNSCNDYILISC